MLEIRAPELRDVPALAYVHITAWEHTYRGVLPDDVLDSQTLDWRREQWYARLQDPRSKVHHRVAVRDRMVVAFIAWILEPGPVTEIQALYIRPDHIGTGVGKALMFAAFEEVAKTHRAARLWVLVDNRNAQGFYEKHGWQPEEQEKTVMFGDTPKRLRSYVYPLDR